MVSIFIGHDYKSGYVKQLFTTHAKKQDYMISKSIVCAFAMACMCLTYLIGGTVAGILVGYDTTVNICSLIIAILGKMIMSFGWASLYTFLNIIFRKYFGISIASSFFFGTGILIIGVAAIVENLAIPTVFLNIFLYGASVNAPQRVWWLWWETVSMMLLRWLAPTWALPSVQAPPLQWRVPAWC